MSDRYALTTDGQIIDTRSNFVLPDNYWIVDLLNLKEDTIEGLERKVE